MKITLILIIIALNNLFGQNLKNYYLLKNKAELAIVDSNYTLASKYYVEAFRLNPKPIAVDLYNFGLLNFLLNNPKEGYAQFQKLVDLDYDIKNLLKVENTPQGKIIIDKYYNSLINIKPSAKKQINYQLKNELQTLDARDQHFRKKEGSYKIYGDTIRKIDIENDQKLRKIIAKYGYPNEYLIGVNEDLYITQPFEIVIWHQTTLNRIDLWEGDLKKAVYQGRLEPHRAASLIENHNGTDTYMISPISQWECNSCTDSVRNKINGKYFYYTPKKIDAVNKARMELYLESFEDYIKKLKFAMRNTSLFKFNYKGIGSGSRHSVVDYESLVMLIKNLKILN